MMIIMVDFDYYCCDYDFCDSFILFLFVCGISILYYLSFLHHLKGNDYDWWIMMPQWIATQLLI